MEKEGKRNELCIEMLGGFHMTWNGKTIFEGENLNGKVLHLLMILIYSGDEGIRREKLLQRLYPNTDVEQASDSLRAISYRLRKSLTAAGLPGKEIISTKGGVYRWQNGNTDIHLDVNEFQNHAAAALEEQDRERKMQLLEEACRAYKGDFLPAISGDGWAAAISLKYRNRFFHCARELASILKEKKMYQRLLDECEGILSKYPCEEWQLLKLDCLILMKDCRKALEYYEKVTADHQQVFGILPSAEMLKRYQVIRNGIQFELNSVEEIREHLRPEKDLTNGATHCDYLTFIDAYRYTLHVAERLGIEAWLALFSITDKKGVPLELSELLEETRVTLETAIGTTIRKSDLCSRYGKNQFIILMAGTDENGCRTAAERIWDTFHEMNRRKRVEIHYSICSVQNIPAHQLEENLKKSINFSQYHASRNGL